MHMRKISSSTDIDAELATLSAELLHAERRLECADESAKDMIAKQIHQIKGDISRYSARSSEKQSYEKAE